MILTLVSMVMVTAWASAISLIWALVRRFHRSKPPGRQTVRDMRVMSIMSNERILGGH